MSSYSHKFTQKGLLLIMMLTDRAMLRLHIEAVWGVKLPPIEANEICLLPESARPDWRLCAADLAEGRVLIWREDIAAGERAGLLGRLDEAWPLPEGAAPPGISRQGALRVAARAAPQLAGSQ